MTRNKFTIFIICAACIFSLAMSGYTAASKIDFADVEVIPVYMNGIRVADGYSINGTTYTSMRSFVDSVSEEPCDLTWDSETMTASLSVDGLSIAATIGNHYLEANGRYLYVPDGILMHEGSLLVPVRTIALVYGIEILWDAPTSSISIDDGELAYIESGDTFYNEDDLYWLSRLIYSESGNQNFDGQIGVGNVVLNRVSDPTCPDNIYDVIFDNKYGVQFSVTTNGTIYLEPDEEAVIAAKICLEGYNNIGSAIYFVNPTIGASSWFRNNKSFVVTIGEHDFYA